MHAMLPSSSIQFILRPPKSIPQHAVNMMKGRSPDQDEAPGKKSPPIRAVRTAPVPLPASSLIPARLTTPARATAPIKAAWNCRLCS